MKTINFYTLILFFSCFTNLSFAQLLDWQNVQTIYDSSLGNTLTIDEVFKDIDGDVYVSGSSAFNLTLGSTVLAGDTQPFGFEQFLAKYTPTGGLLWARQMDLNGENTQIAVDPLKQVHVASRLSENQEYALGDTILHYEDGSLYHAVFQQYWDLLYVHQIDAGPNSFIIDIASTSDHGAVILVSVGDQITLADATFLRSDVEPALDQFGGFYFLLKYDDQGLLQWYHKITARQNWFSQYLREDQEGNIILAGEYHDYLTIGDNTLHTLEDLGTSDIYVCKFTSEGDLLGLATYGSLKGDKCNDVFIDQDNAIYLAGQTGGGTTVFGSQNTEVAFRSPFFVKLKPNLEVDYLRTEVFDSDSNSEATTIAVDASENVLVGGKYFGEDAMIGGVEIGMNSTQGEEVFLAQYDNVGNFCCLTTAGGEGDDQAVDLEIVDGQNIFVVGTYKTEITIEGQQYLIHNQPIGGAEAFVTTVSYSPITAITQIVEEEIGLRLYPNPVADRLTIEWIPISTLSDTWQLSMIDMHGRTISRQTVATSSAQTVLSTTHLPSGMYGLQITDEAGRSLLKKFTVQK